MSSSDYRIDPDFSLELTYEVPTDWGDWSGDWDNRPQVDLVTQDPQGRLLIAGDFFAINGDNACGLARVHADGSLDHSFDSSGNVWGGGTIHQVAFPASGGLLVAGGVFSSMGAPDRRLGNVMKLTESGELDGSFHAATFSQATPTGVYEATVFGLRIHADESIFCCGSMTHVDNREQQGIVRLNPDGSRALGFCTKPHRRALVTQIEIQSRDHLVYLASSSLGLQSVDLQSGRSAAFEGSVSGFQISSFGVQSDGKIVAGLHEPPYLIRLNADGTQDTAFNPAANGPVKAICMNGDEPVVLGTFSAVSGFQRSGLAHLDPDGAPLTSFGENLPIDSDEIWSVVVRESDKYLLTGSFEEVQGQASTGIAQFVRSRRI